MDVYVISNPTEFEVSEMLDVVAADSDLRRILPPIARANLPEWMRRGWCYLWYDAETLAPLGYTLFVFEKDAERFPFFHFAGTRFVRPRHIMKITKAMRAVMRNAFKNQVRAYIGERRIAKFAEANGFRQCRRDERIWIMKG